MVLLQVCVLIPYLGVEWTQDNPAAESEGKEEDGSAENELDQLWEGQGQSPSQSLYENSFNVQLIREREREHCEFLAHIDLSEVVEVAKYDCSLEQ